MGKIFISHRCASRGEHFPARLRRVKWLLLMLEFNSHALASLMHSDCGISKDETSEIKLEFSNSPGSVYLSDSFLCLHKVKFNC
jgi:hypothetical protein